MLDVATLQVALAVVTGCVLVLGYAITYRTTRTGYSMWWCLALVAFIAGSFLYVFDGTSAQVVTNPLGSAVSVLGAACTWAACRSLRGGRVARRWLVPAPTVVLLAGLVDDPAHDSWAGGLAYLLGMGVVLSWAVAELGTVLRRPGEDEGGRSETVFRFSVRSILLACGAVAVFHLGRASAFAAVGPEHALFEQVFGTVPTTILSMMMLVVATFSMSALSHEQQTSELRVRATRDEMTGLLNRGEFLRVAQEWMRSGRLSDRAALIAGDLDDFKTVNDAFGHAAGDRALVDFAEAARAAVGEDGIIGRLGGDEFVLLLDGRSAEEVVAEIARRYRELGPADAGRGVSYGIARVRERDDVALVLARADDALYRAKATGRDRAVRYRDGDGATSSVRAAPRRSFPRGVERRSG